MKIFNTVSVRGKIIDDVKLDIYVMIKVSLDHSNWSQ